MNRRTVLLAAVAVGAGYAVWRLPVTQRFVATVREASARREAVEAGWDRDRAQRTAPTASALGSDDPGRSLSPEQARALLLDPTGERAP